MKFFALLLLFAAMLLVAAYPDEDNEDFVKCGHCYQLKEDYVCAKKDSIVSTYYNKDHMECMQAVLLYEGECKQEDLLNNKLEEK